MLAGVNGKSGVFVVRTWVSFLASDSRLLAYRANAWHAVCSRCRPLIPRLNIDNIPPAESGMITAMRLPAPNSRASSTAAYTAAPELEPPE